MVNFLLPKTTTRIAHFYFFQKLKIQFRCVSRTFSSKKKKKGRNKGKMLLCVFSCFISRNQQLIQMLFWAEKRGTQKSPEEKQTFDISLPKKYQFLFAYWSICKFHFFCWNFFILFEDGNVGLGYLESITIVIGCRILLPLLNWKKDMGILRRGRYMSSISKYNDIWFKKNLRGLEYELGSKNLLF